MSHEKVRSICIDRRDKTVYVTSSANNICPHDYTRWECEYLRKIYRKEGLDAVENEILLLYEKGEFQGGSNKYATALKVLKYVYGEEYSSFNWRSNPHKYGSPEYTAYEDLRDSRRNSDEFKALLRKALDYKLPPTRYVLTKDFYGSTYYGKMNTWTLSWKAYPRNISKFKFRKEAEASLNTIAHKEGISITEVN